MGPERFSSLVACFGVALIISLVLTGGMRSMAKRIGFVSVPRGDRWGTKVIPLGGGFPMAMAILVSNSNLWSAETGLVVPFLAITILGALDDLYGISPTPKLLVQISIACLVVHQGFQFELGFSIASWIVSVAWIVAITNSVNLLDNMDGVSSGVSAISALGLAFLLLQSPGGSSLGCIAAAVAGASFGFLWHNFQPARIYMGDAGSLGLGFLLGTLSTKIYPVASGWPSGFAALMLAGLILAVPLLDTSTVMLSRFRRRKHLMQGGRDHSTHRLARVGFSERAVAAILYFLAFFGVMIACYAASVSLVILVILIPAIGLVLALYLRFFLRVPSEELKIFDQKKIEVEEI